MEHLPVIRAVRLPSGLPDDLTTLHLSDPGAAPPLRFADGTAPPDHLATHVSCFWNDLSFFVLFNGAYETLRLAPATTPTAPSGKTHRLWELSDVFEVFVGPQARTTRQYREFQASPDGRWIDIDIAVDPVRRANHDWVSGVRVTSNVDATLRRWQCAFAIPWQALGAAPGSELQGNFYRATGRHHGDELLAWSPTGYGERCFHRAERFGTIVFPI